MVTVWLDPHKLVFFILPKLVISRLDRTHLNFTLRKTGLTFCCYSTVISKVEQTSFFFSQKKNINFRKHAHFPIARAIFESVNNSDEYMLRLLSINGNRVSSFHF